MKYLVFLLGLLLSSAIVSAQATNANELLKVVEEKGIGYKTITAKLTYILENNQENTTEEITGLIKVKGDKFKLEIDQTITFCDGNTKWVYLEESNEVNVTEVPEFSDMEPEEKFMNYPLSIYDIYKNDFKSNVFGHGELNGKNYTLVDLTPESLDKPYFKIRYWISEEKDVYAVKYFQKDGMRISLFFEDFETNAKLKDSDFVFKESDFEGVEVIDLR